MTATGWYARNPDGSLSFPLDGLISLTFKTCAFARSGWVLVMPADHQAVPVLKENGAGIVKRGEGARDPVTGSWSYDLSALSGHVLPGPGMSAHTQVITAGGGTVTFYGQSDLSFLWDHLIIPATPTGAAWTTTGQMSAVIETLFDEQFSTGGGAIDATRDNGVFEGFDSTTGAASVTLSGRYENCGDALTALIKTETTSIMGISALYIFSTGKVSFQAEPSQTGEETTISVAGGTAESMTVDVKPIKASRVYILDDLFEGLEANDADSDPWSLREIAVTYGNAAVRDDTGDTAAEWVTKGESHLDLGSIGITFEITPGVDVGLYQQVAAVVPDIGLFLNLFVTSRTLVLDAETDQSFYTVGESFITDSSPGGITLLRRR